LLAFGAVFARKAAEGRPLLFSSQGMERERIVITPVMPTYARADLSFERGEGVYLWGNDGRRYVDFGSGVAVNSCGHSHPHLVQALKDQAEKVWHVSNIFRIPQAERLAQRLVDATFADTVFFSNSGAEANEGAIKTARKYHAANGEPNRYRIITFEGAFHGRTLANLAAQNKYLDGFGPPLEGFDQVPFGDLKAVEAAIGPDTAAIMIEPIQGEGGIRSCDPAFLRGLRELCDKHGLMLILDEVQTGVGRSGRFFAHEVYGITPDIMSVAKGIGGGFPLGAVLATEAAARGMVAGTHGSTYGGNPLATAVGNAVLDVILADGFLESVRQKSLIMKQKLAGLVDTYPDVFSEVRGEGLLLGLKCVLPNTEVASALRTHGVLVIGAGDNTVRVMPPLTIDEAGIEAGFERLDLGAASLSVMSKAGVS